MVQVLLKCFMSLSPPGIRIIKWNSSFIKDIFTNKAKFLVKSESRDDILNILDS